MCAIIFKIDMTNAIDYILILANSESLVLE